MPHWPIGNGCTPSEILLHLYSLRKEMDSKQFQQLLINYTALTDAEAQQLILLHKEFPYSQVVSGMLARGAQDNQWTNKGDYLQMSAVHSTDRSVLKAVMTAPGKSRVQIKQETTRPVASKSAAKTEPAPLAEAQKEKISSPIIDLTGDALYNEVMHDIQILKERKLQFEATAKKIEKKFIVTASEALKPRKGKSAADPDEGLLDEIKNSKKKVKPEGPKQKEQRDIIDHFIKNQPTISKAKLVANQNSKEDFAGKNNSFDENIVSETLVDLLKKQGKNGKAIEVLKKLIWKFPQKKAYFAAQIEELKK